MPHCSYNDILDSLLDDDWGRDVAIPKELAKQVMGSRETTISDVCLIGITTILRDTLRALTDSINRKMVHAIMREHHRNVGDQMRELEQLHGPCDDDLAYYVCEQAKIMTMARVTTYAASNIRFGHHTCEVTPPERGTEMRKKWDRWIRRRAKKVVDAQ